MNDRKLKVLLVDDHPLVRAGLSAIVNTQPDIELVGEAGNAAEAIALFDLTSPDVTIVDLTLPDISGIELIVLLRAKSPLAKFVVLSANMGGNNVSRALQAGAHAYLFKNAPAVELLATIRMVSGGGRILSPSVGSRLDEADSRPELSARELEVLRWLVRGHSNSQIAKELCIVEQTVKSHVKSILNKLGVSSRTMAATLALTSGLVREDDK